MYSEMVYRIWLESNGGSPTLDRPRTHEYMRMPKQSKAGIESCHLQLTLDTQRSTGQWWHKCWVKGMHYHYLPSVFILKHNFRDRKSVV